MDRLTGSLRGARSAPVIPSPAGSEATEDEGRQILDDTSGAQLSDKRPAGPVTEPATTGNAAGVVTSRETLDSHLDVRVSRAERDAVRRRGRALGVKPSAWARAVVQDELDDRRYEVEALAAQAVMPRPRPELARAVEQLRLVGVDLNRTRRAGDPVGSDLLREVSAAVDGVRRHLGDEVASCSVSERALACSSAWAVTSRETLDSHLDVRVSRADRGAVDRRAELLGVTPSAWARAVLRDALDERRQEVEVLAAAATVPRPRPELARSVEQLRRVGVNLHQTRRDGSAVDSDLLHEALAAVEDARRVLGDGVAL